jgi:hypothetical protein
MSEWNRFNSELKRRNAAARAFEPSIEEEEANLARRAKEAQNYINASWEKEKANEWAAKSPEEKAEERKMDYGSSFFPTIIDGKMYLQSGIDGALTNDNELFIGYPSEGGIEYRETPDQPYEDIPVWEQNKFGQFVTSNLMNIEDDMRQFEEEHPDMEWGQPRISEDVQQKINAEHRRWREEEAKQNKKKPRRPTNAEREAIKAKREAKKAAVKPEDAPKKITVPNLTTNEGYNEELEGLTKEEWVQAGKIAANELRRRQLLRMRSKSAARVSNRLNIPEESMREVPRKSRTRQRSKSFGGTRRKRKASRKFSA